MLSLLFLPIIVLCTGLVADPLLLFTLYIISGLGMAGVGMGVMHDAIHGSYSKNRRINKLMGYSINLLGSNASVWRIQHNVLHHTYTNINHGDDDINPPFFLRFSPHAKLYWIHRFQHVYVWLFYGLATVSWITVKDFIRISRYKKMGFYKKEGEYAKEMVNIIIWKIIYYAYALALPIIMVPLPAWMVVLAFFTMHFVTGFCISIIFQSAHILSDTEFPEPNEEGTITSEWIAHQLATTSNFAPRSKYFSWLIGGLNYQIEHHLFPNVCHVHYKKLSKIVSETAKEFDTPYLVKENFLLALWDHTKMLRQLGRA
ncbi:MAG: acyl-CoA desaturase [Bacteroidia bacterium]|nr:acyl-CoA desaturase [Bacteroidia bacterium]